MEKKRHFYLVDFEVLPEALKRTIQAKELLKKGEVDTIHAAVLKMGISRSAYYKYKDHVAPAGVDSEAACTTLFLVLHHDPAVSSKLFRKLSKENVEILTMNRGIPVKKMTTMSLTLRQGDMQISMQELIEMVRSIKGIKKVYVAGGD